MSKSTSRGALSHPNEVSAVDFTDSSTSSHHSYVRVMELARGGMGTVHVVIRKEGMFQRLYAIKRLLPQFTKESSFHEMFLDEAKLAGLIRHPNVVSVVDFGQDASGPYLVMDLVDGVSLQQVLKQVTPQEALPFSFILEIAMQTAKGLHAAHEVRDLRGQPLNLVHRDLTPQNILLSWNGIAKVTDFGIAKASDRNTQTSTGILKGKWAYMSPEQLGFQELDRRSDLFALGVVLWEMIVGRRLYGGRGGVKAARRILTEPAPDVRAIRPDTPDALAELTLQLLAKHPSSRLQSAAEVAEALKEIRSTLGAEERAVTVESFLAKHFSEWREIRHRQLAKAIEGSEERMRVANVSSRHAHEISLPPHDTQQTPKTVLERFTPLSLPIRTRQLSRIRPWIGALGLSVLLYIVAVGFDSFGTITPTSERFDSNVLTPSFQENLATRLPNDRIEKASSIPVLPVETEVADAPETIADEAPVMVIRGRRPAPWPRARSPRVLAIEMQSSAPTMNMPSMAPEGAGVANRLNGSSIPTWEWGE